MNTLLVVMNVLLLALVVYLFFIKNRGARTGTAVDDMELIEFQQNLKELINELNSTADTKIKEMESKKNESIETVKLLDQKIKELKYLIERNQLMRTSDYRVEVALKNQDPRPVNEEPEIPGIVAPAQPAKQPKPPKKTNAKFVMKEPAFEPEKTPKTQDKYSHISALLASGMSVAEISKITGLPKGEIELIRNIKK